MKTVLFLMSFLLSYKLSAETFRFDQDKGSVNYAAKGKPSFLMIMGHGKGISGTFTKKDGVLSGDATFELNTLDSGIDLRDQHLKKNYLETDKFPTANLKISDLKMTEGSPFKFTGTLKLHGVEKNIEGEAVLSSAENLKANFSIKLSDFKIGIPSFQGITVAEEVGLTIEALLKKVE